MNGGPRPTSAETVWAHRGIDEARRVLGEIEHHGPDDPHMTSEISAEDRAVARQGIARARAALLASQSRPSPSAQPEARSSRTQRRRRR